MENKKYTYSSDPSVADYDPETGVVTCYRRGCCIIDTTPRLTTQAPTPNGAKVKLNTRFGKADFSEGTVIGSKPSVSGAFIYNVQSEPDKHNRKRDAWFMQDEVEVVDGI